MVYDPANKPQNPYAAAYANFVEQTKDHMLTVTVDDGLNRQMRVGAPGTGIWSWRIITWPGYLATFGDVADGFMFTREADMLRFFDRGGHDAYYSDGAPSIDFRYWAEKTAGGRSRDVLEYSSTMFMQYVEDSLDEHEDVGTEAETHHQKVVAVAKRVCARHDVDFDEYLTALRAGHTRFDRLEVEENDDEELEFFGEPIPSSSPAERRAEIIDEAHRYDESEHEAREWLREHQDVFGEDYWEVSLRDFNVGFLYTCFAIDLTVKLWREYEKTPEAAARRNPGDSYVRLEGGLVQNSPALPVFDLDVLTSDFPNEQSAEEALDLYERLVKHPKAAVDMAYALTAAVDFVRAYGSPEDVQTIQTHEAQRLVTQTTRKE